MFEQHRQELRILLVEDRDEDIYFMRLIINSIGGILLFTAKNGEEAFAQLDIVAPHVILLDLNMPRMGGIEFLRKTKTDPAVPSRFQKIPVFILTTSDLPKDIIEAYKYHASLYFVKPGTVATTKKLILDLKESILNSKLPPYEVI